MKNPFVILLALVLCVLGGACADQQRAHISPPKKEPFNETVISFLMTKDQKQFVVVGWDHHYIFPLTDDLRRILSWQGRDKIEAIDLRLRIGKENVVNADYKIIQRKDTTLTSEEINFLKSIRFYIPKNSDAQRLAYRGELVNGTVYDAGLFKMPLSLTFKKTFRISIHYSFPDHLIAQRRLRTPLAVAPDGVVVIGTGATSFIDF